MLGKLLRNAHAGKSQVTYFRIDGQVLAKGLLAAKFERRSALAN